MPSSWIATLLDQEHIEATGVIAPHVQPVEDMPNRDGSEVAQELGGRMLVRYLTTAQLTAFVEGSIDRGHWVTPTPVAPEEAGDWLALFARQIRRDHALMLDPAKIAVVRGPAWIRLGQGIEYYLPAGFGSKAIVDVGIVAVR